MHSKIYIIGPVGSGKTTLSKILSKKYKILKIKDIKILGADNDG